MRLYNIYYLCKELISVFETIEIIDDNSFSPAKHYISKWKEYKVALETLSKIPMFNECGAKIYRIIPTFVWDDMKPEINESTKKAFMSMNKEIVKQMITIITLYESLNLVESRTGIDVKIPQCKDLKEYIKYLNELDFIFTQCPYLLHKDETIKFLSVDVGSQWLNFLIELSVASMPVFYILNNLALILDKVIILRSHYNSIKQQEESLKIAQNKSELSENEIEIFNALKRHYMSEITSSLENEISPLEDGDQRGRLEKSLEKLCNLLDKGVEIYASIDSPNDVQVLFPTLNEQERLPETILKYLEDKNDK